MRFAEEIRKLGMKVLLTLIGSCIANIFAEYNQQDAPFYKIIYLCKTLYMFQTGFSSIIKSTKCIYVVRQL